MRLTARSARSAFVFAFCVALTIGMLSSSVNAASNRDDVKKAQQILSDKGFYHGPVAGISGPLTRKRRLSKVGAPDGNKTSVESTRRWPFFVAHEWAVFIVKVMSPQQARWSH